MTNFEFAEILLSTGGDLSKLTAGTIAEIMQKAQAIKESAQRTAEQRKEGRKIFAARRHAKAMDEIRDLVGDRASFTPTQIQLEAIHRGIIPMSYQFYAAHLRLEYAKEEPTVARISTSSIIHYKTKQMDDKTRKIGGDKVFFKFI